MYKHILIPTDGSALSERAIDEGLGFAKETGAQVTLVTVTEPFHTFGFDPELLSDTPPEYQRHAAEHAKAYLAAASDKAKSLGVSCDALQLEHDQPYEAIIDAARAKGCDLIVMASHGRRGIEAIVLGSETVKVLTHSKIPVLVCR